MSARQPDDHDPPGSDPRASPLRERWVARYGGRDRTPVEPDRRYSLVRIGNAEYAFTSYDRYVAALKHVWREGLVPRGQRTGRRASRAR